MLSVFTDVQWQPLDNAKGIPPHLHHMISDQDSLTQRLKRQYNNAFSVRLLSQSWQVPTPSEQAFLCCQNEQASVREVLLFGSARPVVFARSVLPESSLAGQNKALLHLGETPLGEYIFNQPGLCRGPIEVATIAAREFNILLECDFTAQTTWARRSLFYLREKPISVCEVFLPSH